MSGFPQVCSTTSGLLQLIITSFGCMCRPGPNMMCDVIPSHFCASSSAAGSGKRERNDVMSHIMLYLILQGSKAHFASPSTLRGTSPVPNREGDKQAFTLGFFCRRWKGTKYPKTSRKQGFAQKAEQNLFWSEFPEAPGSHSSQEHGATYFYTNVYLSKIIKHVAPSFWEEYSRNADRQKCGGPPLVITQHEATLRKPALKNQNTPNYPRSPF